jgi:hypothetical protein
VGFELSQCGRGCDLALAKLGDLALRLRPLALQLQTEIGCPPFGGGALAKSGEFDLGFLPLARPSRDCVAVCDLFILETLLSGAQNAASCLCICI